MRRTLMGLFGLMVAMAVFPAAALAAEGPSSAALEAPEIVVETTAETQGAAGGQTDGQAGGQADGQVGGHAVSFAESQVDARDRELVEEQALAQIVETGGEAQAVGAGDVEVTVGKTIEATGVENYFDITLSVEVSEPIEDDSTAVVIVMDVSNTMNEDGNGRSPGEEGFTTSRLENARLAAGEFISQYCEGEGLSASRMLGLVTFNTNAQWADGMSMQVVSADNVDALRDSLALVTAPSTPNDVRFTNMEAGLQLAQNALEGTDAAHQYVIFLTDGFPTTYIDRELGGNADSTTAIAGYDPYEPGAYDGAEVGSDGYFADAVLGLPCTYGTSYSDKAAERAAAMAASMKEGDPDQGVPGVNIFSVGIAIGSQTVQAYVDRATGTFSIVDRTSDEYVIGSATDPDAYEEWLSEEIAGGPSLGESSNKYANGDNLEELRAAFAEFLGDIKETSGLPLDDAYVVDPMGKWVEFQYLYDVDGAPADELVGELGVSDEGVPFENTASFAGGENAIRWNLMESGHQVLVDDEGKRSYAYELAYRVRLANEAAGFEFGTSVDANGDAVLEYETAGVQNDPVSFPVPAVQGYDGSLSFVKVDEFSGQPIAGASFELRHDENCAACAAAAAAAEGLASPVEVPALQQVSDANGVVSFEGVPSGHDYVLVEIEPASGYLPLEQDYAAAVSFGQTVVVDESGLVVVDGDEPAGSFRIANEPIEPPAPPVVPDVPEVPEVPDVPDVPEVPEVPETPDVPETPESPEVPDVPATPSTPTQSGQPVIPQTGDADMARAVLALVIVAAVALTLEVLVWRKSRKR